jgi:hypothetical protein
MVDTQSIAQPFSLPADWGVGRSISRMKRLRVFIFTLLFIIYFRNFSNSNNLPAASQSVRKCTHVSSKEDEVCGGLWHATQYTGMPSNVTLSQKKIYIVVSHCMFSLDWLPKYIEGFNITSIHIISKCGEEVKGAPDSAVVHVLPNVGRCDHSFVYFITTILAGKHRESIAVFLKDQISSSNHLGSHLRSFKDLVSLASSSNGFACLSEKYLRRLPRASAYHDKHALLKFHMSGYRNKYEGGSVPFKSSYANLGEYLESLNAIPSQDVVPVCYGGVFAASVENIYKINIEVWEKMEDTLTRGDNIEEGHFAERSWAALLSSPIEGFQAEALKNYSSSFINDGGIFSGILIH